MEKSKVTFNKAYLCHLIFSISLLKGYAIHHLQITNVCLVVASMGVSRMMFSWVSEKMVGSGLDGLLLGKNINENMIAMKIFSVLLY